MYAFEGILFLRVELLNSIQSDQMLTVVSSNADAYLINKYTNRSFNRYSSSHLVQHYPIQIDR